MPAHTLPRRFRLAAADDALAPVTPRGTLLVLDTDVPPSAGVGILVQDRFGKRYLRMFAEAVGPGWEAKARHEAFVSLHSERDHLVILAVVESRQDGRV